MPKIKPIEYQKVLHLLDTLASLEFDEISSSKATAIILGAKTSQSVEAHCKYRKEKSMVSSFSDSAFIHTAFESFYENGKIEVYSGTSKENLKAKKPQSFTPEEYLSSYGILPIARYRIKDFETNQKFTSTLVNDDSGYAFYGFLPYELREDTILSYEEKEKEILLTLHPNFATKHYQIQIKKTGGLTELPSFKSVSLVFHLKEGNEISSYETKEQCFAKLGLFSLDITMSTIAQFKIL